MNTTLETWGPEYGPTVDGHRDSNVVLYVGIGVVVLVAILVALVQIAKYFRRDDAKSEPAPSAIVRAEEPPNEHPSPRAVIYSSARCECGEPATHGLPGARPREGWVEDRRVAAGAAQRWERVEREGALPATCAVHAPLADALIEHKIREQLLRRYELDRDIARTLADYEGVGLIVDLANQIRPAKTETVIEVVSPKRARARRSLNGGSHSPLASNSTSKAQLS